MKKLVLVLVALTVSIVNAEAQALPFTKRPVSQEEYAVAIEKNDRSILNVSCNDMVRAATLDPHNVEVTSCDDLAGYVRALVVAYCPNAESHLARVLKGGTIDLHGYSRNFRPKEPCLFDSQSGLWFASLSCGNFVTTKDLPVEKAMVQALMPTEGVETPKPSATPIQDSANRAVLNVTATRQVPAQERRNWISRNGNWVWPLVVIGVGGGVYCAVKTCVVMTQKTTVRVER